MAPERPDPQETPGDADGTCARPLNLAHETCPIVQAVPILGGFDRLVSPRCIGRMLRLAVPAVVATSTKTTNCRSRSSGPRRPGGCLMDIYWSDCLCLVLEEHPSCPTNPRPRPGALEAVARSGLVDHSVTGIEHQLHVARAVETYEILADRQLAQLPAEATARRIEVVAQLVPFGPLAPDLL